MNYRIKQILNELNIKFSLDNPLVNIIIISINEGLSNEQIINIIKLMSI